MNRLIDYIVIILACTVFCSCDTGEALETPFGFEQPAHFPEATYTFDNNPVTKEGFELGRFIFNDPLLSRDSTIACASCHDQSAAFADPQHRLSVGIDALVGIRNAPPIFNLAFKNEFFWDGGVVHIDFIPLNAIANPVELDHDLSLVVEDMKTDANYQEMFTDAFGEDTEINSVRVLHALSQFMVMMVSDNALYDQYLLEGTELGESELRGLALFETHCATCHEGKLFTNRGFHNNGLDTEFDDVGRAVITESDEDVGKFRVPTLRNVALTSPYMHDGRFETLVEVLDHYTHGVQRSETLDNLLDDGTTLGIALTENEQEDIISFLHTLTDEEFISNPLFFAP